MVGNESISRLPGMAVAISNTGPLISAFQSNSFDLFQELFETVCISTVCNSELTRHGWHDHVEAMSPRLVVFKLNLAEEQHAKKIAEEIVRHPDCNDPILENHLGEAQAITLAERQEFQDDLLLIDELAARAVARERGLKLSGFAGVLLSAAKTKLISPEEVKQRMEKCRAEGTHYRASFIDYVYEIAKQEGRGK